MNKINIVVGGTFQVPILLKAFDSRLKGSKVISSTPKFKFPEFIQNEYVYVWVPKYTQLVNRLLGYDFSRNIKEIDIYQFSLMSAFLYNEGHVWGFQGHSLEVGKKAKKRGYEYYLDRACPHILEQERLREIECSNLGIKYDPPSKKYMDRCIEEYNVADRIIVPSEFTRRSFLERGFSEDKLIKLPLTGNMDFNKIKINREKNSKFIVGFIGGALERKGLLYLLKAWHSLSLSNAQLKVKISKQDIQRSLEIKKLIQHPSIEVVPYYNNISDFYNSIDLLAFVSNDEGFGMAGAEAMSHGVPVIFSENVGATDFVQDGFDSFVVPVRDPHEIALKISLFHKDLELRRVMGKQAKITAGKNFNNIVMKSNIEAVTKNFKI